MLVLGGLAQAEERRVRAGARGGEGAKVHVELGTAVSERHGRLWDAEE
jgi:hypothetical protein